MGILYLQKTTKSSLGLNVFKSVLEGFKHMRSHAVSLLEFRTSVFFLMHPTEKCLRTETSPDPSNHVDSLSICSKLESR